MENDKKIRQWVKAHMPEAVEDLSRLCRIRSVAQIKGANVMPWGKGCLDVLYEFLKIGEEKGFKTRNYDDYIGLISYGDTTSEYQKDSIGIWTHLDVVDEGDLSEWEYPPYQPTVKNGYMIARGCQDNKSSTIIGLYTLLYFKEHSVQLKHGLQLYGGTCEEQGMYDLDYYIRHYPVPRLSLVPDAGFPVCCGERGVLNGRLTSISRLSGDVISLTSGDDVYKIPDRAEIVILDTRHRREILESVCCESKPKINFENGKIRIVFFGVTGNAARPSEGVNALSALIRFVLENHLLEPNDEELFRFGYAINVEEDGTSLGVNFSDELSGPTTLVITSAGIQDGYLYFDFASRYPYTIEPRTMKEAIYKDSEKAGFTFRVLYEREAMQFDSTKQSVRLLTKISDSVLNNHDQPYVMSGGTYARKLPNAFAFGAGMQVTPPPSELIKPGHGNYHQADESVSLERIEKGINIYIQAVSALNELPDLLI